MSPPCYLCGKPCEHLVSQGPYRYYACSSCGLSQLFPQPTREALSAFYESFHGTGDSEGLYLEFEGRINADFPAKLAGISKHTGLVPTQCRLLDVGCGKGYFVKAAQDFGFRSEGIDISKAAIDHARNELRVPAHAGCIEEMDLKDWENAFDVATLWATVEHLPNPSKVLRAVHRCLKPKGWFFLDTGIANAPLERYLAGHSQWYDAPQHLFVFSASSLQNALSKAGFDVISVDCNWERNTLRRYVKMFRHHALCMLSFFSIRPLLGAGGFNKLRQEAKWPMGNLLSIAARKNS